ncbi:SagB/ThcOx family dehydrogenase [Arthrobacter sp. 260]|uniref:SagB/ThcOx family dehydrogenase n=1 Tax=Arthrobacter sp. 260 TaxID=2735314 RepID=UPI001491585A|nr:SagB/ThcOx family dehydrogenase [Arthrobacter sp. 260]NOJ58893.1 SagB/ThcOx family dehydrogenase [Arthrobacter sp. 260]
MTTRPDDQLRRMLEQTLIPPTTVTELDPDTIDSTTSRVGSVAGSLAESYQLNSQHTLASYTRLPDDDTRSTVRKFYFETTLNAFNRLHEQETRWTLHASELPARLQQLLSPMWSNPAVVDSLYALDVLVLIDGALWRCVPGAPGFLLEKSWESAHQSKLQAAVPDQDLGASDGLIFVVGHLARSSYLSGDRAVRSVGLTAGVLTGAIFAAGAHPAVEIGVRIIENFIDATANQVLGCDGVERSLVAVLNLAAAPQPGPPPSAPAPAASVPTSPPTPSPAAADAKADPATDAVPGSHQPGPVAGRSAEALEVAAQFDGLTASDRLAVNEALAATADVLELGLPATLQRVTHRIFERSVQEFFTAEQGSTQLPDELVHFTRPDGAGIPLPEVPDVPEATLAEALQLRRSVRSYENIPLELDELAGLLHLAAGSTGTEDGYGVRGMPKFPYPSIGGLDSNELGLIISRVEGVVPGYYVYDKVGHALVPRLRGDLRLSLVTATFESEWLFYAPVVLALVNDQKKVNWKYKTRGYRISHLDQGALMQNLGLVAAALGLGSCAVAGYFDEVLNRILGYEGQDAFVAALMAVGRPNRLSHGG